MVYANMISNGNSVVAAHGSSSSARSSRAASTAAAAADRSGAAQMKPLVVVGSVNADLVLSVDRLPQPGETLGAKGMSFFPGGKVGEQAAASSTRTLWVITAHLKHRLLTAAALLKNNIQKYISQTTGEACHATAALAIPRASRSPTCVSHLTAGSQPGSSSR
jgi:hypothetical protein